MKLRLVALLAAAGIAAVAVSSANAAAPRLIMIHGGTLEEPIVLNDWSENLVLLTEATGGEPVDPNALAGRAHLLVSFYWDPKWHETAKSSEALKRLDPSQADVHGRLYLASSAGGIVLETVFDGVWDARRLPPRAVSILTRHNVLVLTAASSPSGGLPWSAVVAAIGLALALLVAAVLIRHQMRRHARDRLRQASGRARLSPSRVDKS